MAYLNEDGLETLVGKIKGQVVELTSAEYRQLPASKNTDNKLYFVNDETYSYQIDDEPTSGSTGLVKSGGVYNWTSKIGSGTLTTTAKTIIPAINELNNSSTTSAVDAGWNMTFNQNRISKCGKSVNCLIIATRSQGVPTSQYSIFSIPNGYRPASSVYVPCILMKSDFSSMKWCDVEMSSSGEVKVQYGVSTEGFDQIRVFGNWLTS